MSYRVFKIIASLLLFTAIFTSESHAQNVISGQLSERVVEVSFTRDGFYQLTADSRSVVYSGIAEGAGAFSIQLYTVTIDGTSARQLTDFDRDGSVSRFKVTKDSQRVVFTSSKGLFSVSLVGGVPTRLDNPPSQRAEQFIISSDSAHVVFDNLGGIFSVPIGGGTIELLSDTNYPSEGDPFSYLISPDGKFVVFERLEFFGDGSSSLHILSTPIAGGALNELLPTDIGLQDSFAKAVDPTSGRVIYLSARNELQLFSVPISGGNRSPLSMAYNFDFNLRFSLSPNGQQVAYTVEATNVAVDDDSFVVPIGGGSAVKVDSGLVAGAKSCGISFTPDSSRLVFCRGENRERGALFVVDIDSPAVRTALNNGQVVDGFRQSVRHTRDSRALLISSIVANTENVDHRFTRIPIEGGAAQLLFQFESSSTNSPCFNGIDLSADNTEFSYCRSVALDTQPNMLVTQRSDSQRVVEIDSGVTYHGLTRSGEFVVYLEPFGDAGMFRLVSSEATPDSGVFCFPVVTDTSTAVICL